LKEALIEVLQQPEKYRGDGETIAKRFSPDTIAAEYEKLFRMLVMKRRMEG
jgi:hypothetical protein